MKDGVEKRDAIFLAGREAGFCGRPTKKFGTMRSSHEPVDGREERIAQLMHGA